MFSTLLNLELTEDSRTFWRLDDSREVTIVKTKLSFCYGWFPWKVFGGPLREFFFEKKMGVDATSV